MIVQFKVLHEFNSRLSFWNLKKLLCKRIQTYWQLLHLGWLKVYASFTWNKNLLTLLLVYIFPWVRDKSGTWRCSNGIFKRKLSKQKRADLMHIFIDIFLFSTKQGLQYAVSVLPSTTSYNEWCKRKFVTMSCEGVISRYFCKHLISPLHMSRSYVDR